MYATNVTLRITWDPWLYLLYTKVIRSVWIKLFSFFFDYFMWAVYRRGINLVFVCKLSCELAATIEAFLISYLIIKWVFCVNFFLVFLFSCVQCTLYTHSYASTISTFLMNSLHSNFVIDAYVLWNFCLCVHCGLRYFHFHYQQQEQKEDEDEKKKNKTFSNVIYFYGSIWTKRRAK